MTKTSIYFKNVTTDATSIGSVESGTSIYDTYDYFIHPHWKQFAPIPDHWHYIVGVYIMCVGITGVIGNGIVIWIFGTTKQLKTPSNMLIINLALSDFTFSLVNGFPLFTISSFNKRWLWGDQACQFYGFIGGLFGLMSINTLAAISIDRYINIAYPLSAVRYMTKRKALMMIGIVWVWSLVWAVPPIFGWGAYIPEGFQTSCTFDYLTGGISNRSYIFGMYIGSFVIPLIAIIACYIMILKAIRNHDKEMIKMAKKLKAEDIRANQEKNRAEVRIAKIAMGIVFLYLMSWSPYAIVALIGQFGPAELVTPLVSELPVLLAKTCAMHNPVVYAFSHPKFREALHVRLPFLVMCCKPQKKPTKSTSGTATRITTRKRNASRVISADTTEPRDSMSEASSCISNIDGSVNEHSIHMNRTVSELVPDGDYGGMVVELVRALVGVANRQPFLSSIYMNNVPNSNSETNFGAENQAFNMPHGHVSSYLSNLISSRGGTEAVGENQASGLGIQTEEAFKLLKEDSKTELLESSTL